MIALNYLFHPKSSLRSWDIPICVFPSSLHFFLVGHCLEDDDKSKINIRVYVLINCVNKNLIAHFIWYLEKEKRSDIWTLPIDRELNKKYFYGKNVHQTRVPVSFSILVNNPKETFHARNYSKNKIFWKRIIKKPQKCQIYFFLSNPAPFNGHDYERKKEPETCD